MFRTYVETYNDTNSDGTWNLTKGIFKGLLKYNTSEFDPAEFHPVLFDEYGATLGRDCSVSNPNSKKP